MKKTTKKKNSAPDRKISHTFDDGFTIYLGPDALRHLDEVNRSLKKIDKLRK